MTTKLTALLIAGVAVVFSQLLVPALAQNLSASDWQTVGGSQGGQAQSQTNPYPPPASFTPSQYGNYGSAASPQNQQYPYYTPPQAQAQQAQNYQQQGGYPQYQQQPQQQQGGYPAQTAPGFQPGNYPTADNQQYQQGQGQPTYYGQTQQSQAYNQAPGQQDYQQQQQPAAPGAYLSQPTAQGPSQSGWQTANGTPEQPQQGTVTETKKQKMPKPPGHTAQALGGAVGSIARGLGGAAKVAAPYAGMYMMSKAISKGGMYAYPAYGPAYGMMRGIGGMGMPMMSPYGGGMGMPMMSSYGWGYH